MNSYTDNNYAPEMRESMGMLFDIDDDINGNATPESIKKYKENQDKKEAKPVTPKNPIKLNRDTVADGKASDDEYKKNYDMIAAEKERNLKARDAKIKRMDSLYSKNKT
jgi:hypothetical protein